MTSTVLNNAQPADRTSAQAQGGLELRIATSASFPLGRRLTIIQADGAEIEAEASALYASHRRFMEQKTIEQRIAHLARLRDGGRFQPEELLCLAIDQHLRPGHLLELHQHATRLQRYAPGTVQNRDGRRLRKLLVQIEQRFAAGGARGFGRANRVEGDRLPLRRRSPRTGQLETAKSMLAELLANGRRITPREAEDAAQARGISAPTLRRARRDLGVRTGGGRGSLWSFKGDQAALDVSTPAKAKEPCCEPADMSWQPSTHFETSRGTSGRSATAVAIAAGASSSSSSAVAGRIASASPR